MLPGSLFRNGFSAVDFHTAEKAHILFRKHTPIGGGVCIAGKCFVQDCGKVKKHTPLRKRSSQNWLKLLLAHR